MRPFLRRLAEAHPQVLIIALFLVDYITEHADDETGEVLASDVIAAGMDKNFTENQIKIARRRCDDPKIATRREGFGENGKTFWKINRDR